MNGGRGNGIAGHTHVLSAFFQRDDGSDLVIIVSDDHAAFAQQNRALENAGVSLDKAGEFSDRKIFQASVEGSEGFAAGGDDVFRTVFAAGHQIFNFRFGKQVGEDVLLNEIDPVVLEPSFCFSAAGASWRCIENDHKTLPPGGLFLVGMLS